MANIPSSEDLRAELATLADTLEEVLSGASDKSKVEIEKLHKKARAALHNTRESLGESGQHIAKTTREAAHKADNYVHEKPWHGVGIGAAIGVVFGILISRR
ncbi:MULTISPECIES: YqjD family protein [Tatumella]|uniref:YqjD family protein n=1 Tax=Tatumella punctata TaxID=399969 RepID=A0ABW1VIN2_9GAMM|nr:MULTISPECIES: YqjD family protein [unclassified Tatumella]MBS0855218.1 DUF883 domain-containing protein [Tatumella sp. JGM16]MBS0876770.1 DUF883 domain-containing protein [Tatumella sp. JGM82]MBS0889805.1 DUF883 domain-containing protein [Tatumella sp. JGM94]MBS0892883.1 DUF883 domain-containing protein [Tatumella sp. JGM130]MBS0901525.1 DUF883 domain-containing protein [Tatumella sp. JGM100]